MMRSKNKKAKPVTVFSFVYSTAINPAAASLAANYHVDARITNHAKKKPLTALELVSFTSNYDPATNTVSLTIKGKPNFAEGGEITVNASPPVGVESASGVPLNTNDTTFAILPKLKGITILP